MPGWEASPIHGRWSSLRPEGGSDAACAASDGSPESPDPPSLAPLPGIQVRRFERNVELTPPQQTRDAVLSLHGAESAILELSSDQALDATAILAALRPGWGRGESRK